MSPGTDERVKKEIKERGLEHLSVDGELYAIVLRSFFQGASVRFFTPPSFSQQLGYLPHAQGDRIKPHAHRITAKTILYTQEVLIVKEGRVRVGFYDGDRRHVFSEELATGDIILLCAGGHGFEFLEDTVLVEIKQGPYSGSHDKQDIEER